MKYDLEYFQGWIDRYLNFERAPDARMFRLETTERLAGLFDHPERSYKTYHVAGSKGKGSVSKMLACILQEMDADDAVGVYASPHAYDFRERMARAEGFFEKDIYNKTAAEFITRVDALPDAQTCGSWFELNTAFAFLLFRNAGARHAVFEVGMGGRLDATNIIRPELCCITEIELEHTAILGDTREKIAAEKAGIIKEKTPVVVAKQASESVREVFRRVAKEKQAPLYFVDELAEVERVQQVGDRLQCRITGEIFRRPLEVRLRMLGDIQATNAMQAAVAMKLLYPELEESVIERGLERAMLPGRFEMRGNMVLDGSHTVESIANCVRTFTELYPEPRVLLFGIAEGKDVNQIAPLFNGNFEKIFVTKPGDFKKSDLGEMRAAFEKAGMTVTAGEDYGAIIREALDASADKALLVTGSFYLIGEVDKILKERR